MRLEEVREQRRVIHDTLWKWRVAEPYITLQRRRLGKGEAQTDRHASNDQLYFYTKITALDGLCCPEVNLCHRLIGSRSDDRVDVPDWATLTPMMLLLLSNALRLASVLISGMPDEAKISLEIWPSLTMVQKEKLFLVSPFFGRCPSSEMSGV